MKVIILAAGQGTRLRPLTNERPKCLVELQGTPLLDHQLTVLKAVGITDLNVVAGYLEHCIERPGLKKFLNPDFASTNMVSTLFCAADLMTGEEDIIITYGDVVYEERVIRSLMDSEAPISLTVDLEWRRYWQARMEDPLADAETLRLKDGNRIVELGKKPESYDDIQGQYMGLIKVRADQVLAFRKFWQDMDRSKMLDGKDFDNMFMTTFLQQLIDNGWDTRAVFTNNGWMEIDAPEDLAFDASDYWQPHKG